MRVAAALPLQVGTRPHALTQANQALDDLRAGRFAGAAVLTPQATGAAALPRTLP